MPTPLPQLFCPPNLRFVTVTDRLVLLDLSAGTYEVVDEVGAAMWVQLTMAHHERDIPGLAEKYGAPTDVVESDLIHFAEAQQAAGRLTAEPPAKTPQPVLRAPRHRPTVLRALWERATAERDLRKGFAAAYTKRTGPMADTTAPRSDVAHLTKLFRTGEGLYPAREAPLDCLPRSLALTRFLRTAGFPAQHTIGVALYPFEAHAWVELDGVPLNESAASLPRFTVIQRA